MMRSQVRILSALLTMMLLVGTPALAQETPPSLVEAPAEKAADSPEITAADGTPANEASETPMDATEDAGDEATSADETPEPEEPARPPLSPEMAALRDQVRRTVAQVYARSLSAQTNLPTEIIAFCEAFGNSAEISSGSRSGQKINAVGAVCWNHPCGGYKLLRSGGQQIVARVGYGYQQRPAQLLAMLAVNRVPATYEIRIGDHHATVADLVASEKKACRSGLDLSAMLIGLAFYADSDQTWQNDVGDSWSVSRLLEEELDRKADAGAADVIHRLMGISFAAKQLDGKDSSDALLKRAKAHVDEFHDYALGLQNSDGTWHPGFFAFQGTSKDTLGTLGSTGTILAWLAYSLPEERLQDQRMILGLTYLNKQLAYRTGGRSAAPSSTAEVVAIINAARALALYDVRYFTPRTPTPPVKDAADSAAQRTRSQYQR